MEPSVSAGGERIVIRYCEGGRGAREPHGTDALMKPLVRGAVGSRKANQ